MKAPSGGGPIHRDWFGLDVFRPGPRFTRHGAVLYLLDEVGSTNAFLLGRGDAAEGRLCEWDGWGWQARERAHQDPPGLPRPGTVVVARRQIAGRGRQGRQWFDCGGLNLSVLVPEHRASFARGFSVWLGLITVLTLREEFDLDVRLKWPNDLLVQGRKLGGILVEAVTGDGPAVVAAGLGLNTEVGPAGFPPELQGNATSIRCETGRTPRLGELAGRILARVEEGLDAFAAEGWQPFRPALACLDCLLGQPVRLVSGDRIWEGRAAGLDDGGRLLLKDAAGKVEAHPVGDVHLVPTTGDGEETP
ncbi:MAG: biotin--[acetyl-CoA-carboxylase] ligase [bacterium]|nr:biotin--[acetyl-CoA-carboxylase] ligase [bacterium]